MDEQEIRELVKKYNWRTNIEVTKGIYTGGKVDVKTSVDDYLKRASIDLSDIKGKKILDIGAWDGGFSFYLEKLGAEVTAVDVMDPDEFGFNLLKRILNSKVKFHRMTVYDISPERMGLFDIVLFSGVFYHLKHPLLALEKINSIINYSGYLFGAGTTSDHYFRQGDQVIQLQNECHRANDFPIAFYADGNFMKDKTNWVIPNQKCLENWLNRSGLEIIDIRTLVGAQTASGESRSQARFVAQKVSLPEMEHNYL